MGTDNLINRVNGQVIDQDWFNIINRVFQGDFVGRDSSGAPTSNQNLGTATVPWGTLRAATLILGGSAIDPGLITAPPNRIVSGRIRATSDFPDFLRPAGAGNGNDFDFFGSATNLVLDVNGSEVTFNTDINKAGLTVATGATNTCLVNDTGLTGQDSTKNLGEDGSSITVDAMGANVSSKVGDFVALKNQTSGEYFYCLVESTIKLSQARRGFYFDELGTPIPRDVLNNNEVLQIMSLGFIFADQNTTTLDVTYRNPTISHTTPGSPQTGDYWFDTSVSAWKRYDGAIFVSINRTYIGQVIIDTVDAVGARSEYFSKSYSDENGLQVLLEDVDTMVSRKPDFSISVDGSTKLFDFSFTRWAAGSDFESGVSRTISTSYYLYITEDGDTKISDKKSYDTRGFLLGRYHPFESWRFVGEIFNNASDEFEPVEQEEELFLDYRQYLGDGTDFTATGTNWTTVRAVAIPYQTIDRSWRLRFNVVGDFAPGASNPTVTISGVTFLNVATYMQAISTFAGGVRASGRVTENTGNIVGNASGAEPAWSFSGDVELDSKPDWAD